MDSMPPLHIQRYSWPQLPREHYNMFLTSSAIGNAPPLLQMISAVTDELLSDTILLIVQLLFSISPEKGLKMLFRDQTNPLVFSHLFHSCGRHPRKTMHWG